MVDKPADDVPTETESNATTATGTISGTVTDPGGDPVDGAEVRVFPSGSNTQVGIDRTDATGSYSEEVSTGTYRVLVENAGFDPAEREGVDVFSNTTTTVDVTLSRAFRRVIGETTDPYGLGVLGRNATGSGWGYGVKAVVESPDRRSAAFRGLAPNGGVGLEVTSEEDFGVVARSGGLDAVAAKTTDPGSSGVYGIAQPSSGGGNGIRGVTYSVDPGASGVSGSAVAGSGTAKGVEGSAESPDGYGVYSGGRLHAERSVKAPDPPGLGDHVATFVNDHSDDGGDVLGLKKANTTDPSASTNYVSFFDASGQVGRIEGSGGGINYRSATSDLAEYFPKADPDAAFAVASVVGLRAGEVVADPTGGDLALVVSDAPMVTGNAPPEGDEGAFVRLALLGQVPVRIGAPVEAGDPLVATADGTAVPASTGRQPAVGRALAGGEAGETVRTFVAARALAGTDPTGRAAPEGSLARRDARIDQLEGRVREKADRLDDLDAENERLRRENEALRERLNAVEERLASLERGPERPNPADD